MYSWCHNNNVALSLVSSIPSRFEGKLWTNYDDEGCDEADDYYDYTDVEYQVENFTMINENMPSKGIRANYSIVWPSGHTCTKIQERNTKYSIVYFY